MRDIENLLDGFYEAALSTDGAVSVTEVWLTVADDKIDALAQYARLPEPQHKTTKGLAWRETAGQSGPLKMRLSTAARRFTNAA
jgi:hypothetical protein